MKCVIGDTTRNALPLLLKVALFGRICECVNSSDHKKDPWIYRHSSKQEVTTDELNMSYIHPWTNFPSVHQIASVYMSVRDLQRPERVSRSQMLLMDSQWCSWWRWWRWWRNISWGWLCCWLNQRWMGSLWGSLAPQINNKTAPGPSWNHQQMSHVLALMEEVKAMR